MMHRFPHWTPIAATVAAVVLGLAVTVTAGGEDTISADEHGAPTDAHVEGPTPADADAATAVRMALAAMFTWHLGTDPSPGAALARAGEWLTGDLAEAATAPAATEVRAVPEWAAWRASADIVTALVDTRAPEPGGDQTTVAATVEQLVLHTDGSRTPYTRLHVVATVTHTPAGWRMSSYRIDPGGP